MSERGGGARLLLTISWGSGHNRRLTEDYHVTSRYWKYRFYALVREPGDVDDAWAGIFLRRGGWAEERGRHHDAKFCFGGVGLRGVLGLWGVFSFFLGCAEESRSFLLYS